jgi:uncharacterized membrane protein YfcA
MGVGLRMRRGTLGNSVVAGSKIVAHSFLTTGGMSLRIPALHGNSRRRFRLPYTCAYGVVLVAALALLVWHAPAQAAPENMAPAWPWWVWPIVLFALTTTLGVLAALAGIGGGVLFVPIVTGLLPFLHIDFVRGAGLMVALSGALAAGPTLLRQNLAFLPLAIPIALVTSFSAIFGAMIGLAMPAHVVQILLGGVILGMFALMLFSTPSAPSRPEKRDPIAAFLGLRGSYFDAERGEMVDWEPRRMALGLVLFSGVGVMAGMFGLGAGWANVPVLTMVMGVPLKIAVGTSYFLLAITDTSAAWVYMNRGALIPLIIIPSALGIMLGAKFGAKLLVRAQPRLIRLVVLGVLLLAGLRAITKGFGL